MSGMKSMPGLTLVDATAVTSTIVSPYRITTEPSACLAMRPVSMVSSLPPKLTPSRTNMSRSLGSNAAATDSSLFSLLQPADRVDGLKRREKG